MDLKLVGAVFFFLEWLQWLRWSFGQSPHLHLVNVVWRSAAVAVVGSAMELQLWCSMISVVELQVCVVV